MEGHDWATIIKVSTCQSPRVILTALLVIAGELEGSWRAGGQQEGLQYNGEAAGWKVISVIFL